MPRRLILSQTYAYFVMDLFLVYYVSFVDVVCLGRGWNMHEIMSYCYCGRFINLRTLCHISYLKFPEQVYEILFLHPKKCLNVFLTWFPTPTKPLRIRKNNAESDISLNE